MSGSVKYPEDVVSTFVRREAVRQAVLESSGLRIGTRIEAKPVPPPAVESSLLKILVETMLFTSMATEEGHVQPVGIVFGEQREDFETSRWDLITIREPRRFDVGEVTKLAAICEFPRSCLAVMPAGNVLNVVGVATPKGRSLFRSDDLVRVLAPSPGIVVVGRGTREIVRYVRGSIPDEPPIYWQHREGKEQRQLISIADSLGVRDPQPHDVLPRAASAFARGLQVFAQIFRVISEMSQLGHGGILAILGPKDDAQPLLVKARVLDSPIEYGSAVRDQQEAFTEWVRKRDWERVNSGTSLEHLERMQQQLVRFTAVDGAVLLNHSLQVLGFGVKLPVSKEPREVVQVNPDGTPGSRWPLEGRGTRHSAAANFAAEHRDGLAFIVSQDGDAAVFQAVGEHVVYWPLGVPVGDLVAG